MTDYALCPAQFRQEEEFALFERGVRGFLDKHCGAVDQERWRAAGQVDRSVWQEAGKAGLLGISVSEEFGGGGGDFRHEAVIVEAISHAGADAFMIALHNAVILPYITSYGTPEQKSRWLPGLCTGELISAIAMTEPAAGSDLQGMRTVARRTAGGYALSGQKTFISNGQTANLIVVAAKTDPDAGSRGISLFVVETDRAGPGFARGRNLEKVGLEGQDTSELFFDDLHLSEDALLGGVEGLGLQQLMSKLPQERLVIALQAIAIIERVLAETIEYARQRKMFGQALIDFQNTQFKLAEYKTEGSIAKVFVNHCMDLLLADKLDSSTASMAKYWVSELLTKVVDGCLQLHGGYGYMTEYYIGRAYRDSRIHRIYGGSNEIMKMMIARNL